MSIRLNLLDSDTLEFDLPFTLYIKEVLIDLEHTQHNQLARTSYGGKEVSFRILLDTIDQSSIGRITRATRIAFNKIMKKEIISKVSYESIGGLDTQIKAIREMVEGPLMHPEIFTKFGLSPSKGLLLYGPPGTGKTLLAKAVASEAGAHVIVVNGPEILSKYHGETETKLKRIFEEAAVNSPSIIFMDEIDSFCPKREESGSDLEKGVVACLLALMDGIEDSTLEDSPKIFVIGATNRPNAIDSALRRPGRFDREFEIGIPTPEARLQILQVLLKNIPNEVGLDDLKEIANRAHGYVGADLSAIIREAGVFTIKRLQLLNPSSNDLELSVDSRLIISLQDMIDGMANVRPSVVREIMLEVPKVYWHDIGGQNEIKQKLKEAVEWPLKHPEIFIRFNIRPPKGLLLYGPPGCSKTLMAKALATEAGLNFLAVKGPELFSKWVGESEKAVRKIFKKARAASPSIIFFDEIDSLAVKRSGQDSSVADRVLSQLLSEMDGIEPLVNVTVVAATNRPDILDSALLRPGRIDSILYVSPPDFESRKSIFIIQLRKIPGARDINVDELAQLSDGFSGAEAVAACRNAALLAMEENLDTSVVEQRHFLAAIYQTTKRITPAMIQFYADFQNKSGLTSI